MKTSSLYLKLKKSQKVLICMTAMTLFGGLEVRSQNFIADPSFNPSSGANNSIWTSELQSDGKIVIAGDFINYNGVTSPRIARVNTNGTIDSSFNVGQGFNNTVWMITIQPNGKILVAGNFNQFNGSASTGLVRLNSDGSRDNSFSPPQSLINVRSVKVQSDGKILVGGFFSSKVIRLLSSGLLDTSFLFPSPTFLSSILDIEQLPDGKLLIAGGVLFPYRSVYRLHTNGTIDASFTADQSVSSVAARCVTVQQDGRIIVGGDFTFTPGNGYIARLMPNGTRDNSFSVGTGTNGIVWASAVLSNGVVLLGGGFTSYNGSSPQRNLIALNSNGSINAQYNFGSGFSNGTLSGVLSLNVQPDSKIIACGEFSNFNGVSRLRIARLSNQNNPPIINVHPISSTVCSGASQSLSVTASSLSLMTYQWMLDGSNIPGATNWTHVATLPGSYTVIVSNAFGSVQSNAAQLNNFAAISEPTYPSCALKASNLCINENGDRFFSLSWIPGSGNKQLVVVSANPIIHFPSQGASYVANSIYGMGQDLGNNTFVVYDGTDDSVYVSFAPGLSTRVYFAVFDYNDFCNNPSYLTSSFSAGLIESKIPTNRCLGSIDLPANKDPNSNLSNTSNSTFQIFPNPNNGEFKIQNFNTDTKKIVQLKVTSSAGSEILKSTFVGSEYQIDLKDNAKGLYFIHLSDGANQSVIKVIKE
jgi:uncharacterized delta-60 repeat protein